MNSVSYSFEKRSRLRKNGQYRYLRRNGTRFIGDWIIVESLYRNRSQRKLGITVTKKYGKANKRNRFKRLVREAFRTCQMDLPEGVEFNVRPRTKALQAKAYHIAEEMRILLAKGCGNGSNTPTQYIKRGTAKSC